VKNPFPKGRRFEENPEENAVLGIFWQKLGKTRQRPPERESGHQSQALEMNSYYVSAQNFKTKWNLRPSPTFLS